MVYFLIKHVFNGAVVKDIRIVHPPTTIAPKFIALKNIHSKKKNHVHVPPWYQISLYVVVVVVVVVSRYSKNTLV